MKKQKVAAALTEAFAATTPFGVDVFGIRFFEYDWGDTAVGGSLVEEGSSTVYLHFLLYCPRLQRLAKLKLVGALSQAFTNAMENSEWLPVIHICEHPYDNVGVGGKILSEAYAECAQREFYYDLPKD